MFLFFIASLIFCLLGTAVCLLIAFLMLPIVRDRYGGRWALALIPCSTFVGTYIGWTVLLVVF